MDAFEFSQLQGTIAAQESEITNLRAERDLLRVEVRSLTDEVVALRYLIESVTPFEGDLDEPTFLPGVDLNETVKLSPEEQLAAVVDEVVRLQDELRIVTGMLDRSSMERAVLDAELTPLRDLARVVAVNPGILAQDPDEIEPNTDTGC